MTCYNVAMNKMLPSADDAPHGSVILPKSDPLTIRYPDGRGWHLLSTACATTRKGWLWREHDIAGPVQLIASGLTEDECHTLSGMSAADAALWCERRAAVMLQSNPYADAIESAALYATEARLRARNAPYKVLEYIQQAAMWLEDGPCEDCGGYHESGSC